MDPVVEVPDLLRETTIDQNGKDEGGYGWLVGLLVG